MTLQKPICPAHCCLAPIATARVQDEYVDVSTLEQRLQSVARRMVSTTSRSGSVSRPNPGPQQHGAPGPSGAAQPAYAGQAAPYSGSQAQQQALPPGSAGLGQTSTTGPGDGAGQAQQFAGQAGRMQSGQIAANPASSSPQQVKLENGTGALGLDAMAPSGAYQPGFRGLPGGTGAPVMSNGAPVLLRGSRDWVPGQSLGMIQARSCLCAAAFVTAKLQKQLTDKVVHLLADRSWSAGIPDNHQWCVHCILSWPSFLCSVSFRMLYAVLPA